MGRSIDFGLEAWFSLECLFCLPAFKSTEFGFCHPLCVATEQQQKEIKVTAHVQNDTCTAGVRNSGFPFLVQSLSLVFHGSGNTWWIVSVTVSRDYTLAVLELDEY